jgi:hypothetical protein
MTRFVSVFLTVLLASIVLVHAQAPVLPLTVKGSVQVDSSDAPLGTQVVAMLGGEVLARGFVEDEGLYVLAIPGNSSLKSVEIAIFVNTIDTGETVLWEEGGIIDLDLSVGGTPDEDEQEDLVDEESIDSDEDEPLGDEPVGEPLPYEPPGDTPEGPDDGAVEGSEETTLAQPELQDLSPKASKPLAGDVGDNSTLFILLVVIIAAIFLVTILYKKHSGGK